MHKEAIAPWLHNIYCITVKHNCMKKIISTLLVFSLSITAGYSQAVIADPAVNFMRTAASNSQPVDPLKVPLDSVIELKVPVINYNHLNALPSGSCKIKIGLGSRMVLDPNFDLSTANTSNYFNWTAEMAGGQMQITGDLRASLPGNFEDTVTFRVKGSLLGSSTITTNFLVTNHNTTVNLSDENGTNNNTSLAYTVVEVIGGPLPVSFTKLTASKQACNVTVDCYTENEINVDRFELEVSKNGTDYEKLGTLAAGNRGHYQFSFTINEALSSPQLFVRIRSVDIDASFQYSDITRVSGQCNEKGKAVIVFPNPAPSNSTYLTIRTDAGLFNGTYSVSALDMAGKLISRKAVYLNNVNQFRYDHGFLAAGQYIIQVQKDNNEVFTMKWQKK